jgi:phosphohistidine swiveling domain-containing protein
MRSAAIAGGSRDVPIVQGLIVKARIVRDGMTQAAATRRTTRRQR